MPMARKKTRAELESEVARLQAAEEALYALTRAIKRAGYWGPGTQTFFSGAGEDCQSIEVVGIERASGGVVVGINGAPCSPEYLIHWCQRVEANPAYGPYVRDVCRQARRAQVPPVRVPA